MRILIALAFVIGTIALAALLVGRASPDDRRGSITLVGDSLNVGVVPSLAEALPGWRIANESVVGRRTAEGVESARALGQALAPVVVVSLGTNDPPDDVAGFRQRIEELMTIAGASRCVIWSTIWRGGPSETFDDALRGAARMHRNLELDDWSALVSVDAGLLAADGLHGSPEGYRRRAQSIARIARGCLPRDGAR